MIGPAEGRLRGAAAPEKMVVCFLGWLTVERVGMMRADLMKSGDSAVQILGSFDVGIVTSFRSSPSSDDQQY